MLPVTVGDGPVSTQQGQVPDTAHHGLYLLKCLISRLDNGYTGLGVFYIDTQPANPCPELFRHSKTGRVVSGAVNPQS